MRLVASPRNHPCRPRTSGHPTSASSHKQPTIYATGFGQTWSVGSAVIRRRSGVGLAIMAATTGVVSGPVLLEGDAALGAVVDALDSVADASVAAVFVAGAAGMGKTSVLELARPRAKLAGFRVASAVGSQMEIGLPFGLVGQAIAALSGSEVDDPVELQRLGGQPARLYRMFRWLTSVAADSPLVLALDDLHWADPDSLELIGFVCRRLAGCRILVLGCLRPEPDPAWMLARELIGAGQASMISLAPLSDHASRALLEQNLSRELDPDQSQQVVTGVSRGDCKAPIRRPRWRGVTRRGVAPLVEHDAAERYRCDSRDGGLDRRRAEPAGGS